MAAHNKDAAKDATETYTKESRLSLLCAAIVNGAQHVQMKRAEKARNFFNSTFMPTNKPRS